MQRSASFALFMIGLLVMGVAGWYIFRRSAQPEPLSPTASIQLSGPLLTTVTVLPPSEIPQPTTTPIQLVFDGQRAYEDVQVQVAMGPRIPGTEGHARFQEWAGEQLQEAGWQLEIQESVALGNPIENLVARRGDSLPQVILGAHYDTRIFADSDPDPANHALPVPGANDGASGVAVLLELARVLPQNTVPIWLVFFDAEDNGRIEGWDWILGSREFVRSNSFQPRAAIIVDMVGDVDLKLYKEANSDPALTDSIWAVAQELGYGDIFLPEYIGGITDDHIPFVEAGIPAIDIIDLTYPYWHTVADTPDKVSAESLQAVGETLQTWIMQQTPQP